MMRAFYRTSLEMEMDNFWALAEKHYIAIFGSFSIE